MTDRTQTKSHAKSGPASSAGRRAELEIALEERSREIAFLTLLLREQEALGRPQAQEREWLRELALVLYRMPRWWALMPRRWRTRRTALYLQDAGLFDSNDYLRRNPDVAVTGGDPLRHYLQHGIKEGRTRSA